MVKQYSIVGFGKTGRYLDFDDAILVKIVSADELDYYMDIKDNPAYEEEQMQCEHWLMFKNYPGKLQQIRRKAEDCQEGKVWYIDLENDFVLRSTSITNQQTGEGFIRPICQVIMVNPDLDIIDAKAKGESYKGRNAAEKYLDELGLALEGEEDLMNEMNAESELSFNAGGDAKVQAIVEAAATGSKTYDEIMADWTAAWNAAQDELGVEVKY